MLAGGVRRENTGWLAKHCNEETYRYTEQERKGGKSQKAHHNNRFDNALRLVSEVRRIVGRNEIKRGLRVPERPGRVGGEKGLHRFVGLNNGGKIVLPLLPRK